MTERGENIGIADFKQTLIDAVFSPNVAIDEGVKSIDLGVIGKEADDVLRRSLDDKPQFRERGKPIYVTADRRVIFPVEDTVAKIMYLEKELLCVL